MNKVYLKIIFSTENELKFIRLNLKESFDYIDKLIITECNRTHTGEEKELIFENYPDYFTKEEKDKIIYVGSDISKYTKNSKTNSDILHNINERTIRGYFAKEIDLDGSDIIFSVDADEILFKKTYEDIIPKFNKFSFAKRKRAYLFNLYQFFYKMNYLWLNKEFKASSVCRFDYYKQETFNDWRYIGKLYKNTAGCHFSWQLTIDEMIWKLKNYGHSDLYGHLAKKSILEKAIENKTYPFDPKVEFDIKGLDILKDKKYYPRSIYSMLNEFSYLL